MRTVTLKNVTVTEEELREALKQLEAPALRQGVHMDVCVYNGRAQWLMLSADKLRQSLNCQAPFLTLHTTGAVSWDNGKARAGYTYAPGTLTLGVKS